MVTVRVLLKEYVTRGEIEYMALDYEWQLYTDFDRAEGTGYKVWLEGEGDRQSVIIYTEDDLAGLRYVSVDGPDAESVAERVRASVDAYSREELEAGIAQATGHSEWIRAVRRLGASLSRAYELWAFDLLCRGLNHSDARVRLAAIAASGFPAWPEFLPALDRLRETDPDPRVVRRAGRLAALIRQTHAAPGGTNPGAPP